MNAETLVLRPGDRDLSGAALVQRVLLKRLAQLRYGALQVQFDQGKSYLLQGAGGGPLGAIHIHRPRAFARSLLLGGDIGFAESYMRGEWSSQDLPGLLYLLSVNLDSFGKVQQRSLPVLWVTRLQHALKRNSRRGSRRNIAAHYDLGNDFYARWLDRTMSYSAALFDRTRDLAQAQERKYQRMLEQLDAQPGQHVLEIGCGWGGFAEHAARAGLRVTAITLSQQQFDYAQQRLANAGLSDRVDLRLCDYRQLQGEFDHIVSIEMFEAVGRKYWQGYFDVLDRCLKPGGRVALQIITIREDLFDTYVRESGGFIQRYIFPGGMLPTEQHLQRLATDARLESLSLERYGEHYADTLSDWLEAFNRQTEWLEAHGYDQRFRRMWRYYLAFCEAGFRDGRIDLVHLCLNKP